MKHKKHSNPISVPLWLVAIVMFTLFFILNYSIIQLFKSLIN